MLSFYHDLKKKVKDYYLVRRSGEPVALIILGDSRKVIDVLSDVGMKYDAVITDPPYNFDSSGGKVFWGRDKNHFEQVRQADITSGYDYSILTDCAATAPSLITFLHNDEVMQTLSMLSGGDDSPYKKAVLCAWHKTNPLPVANRNYMPDTEFYIHAWRAPFYPQGAMTEKQRYILRPVGKSDYDHPTVKPYDVMRKCIINGSKPGDTIFDPFCGSGSTGVAALRNGRFFIGVEINPEFYDIARHRLMAAAGIMISRDDDEPLLFDTKPIREEDL